MIEDMKNYLDGGKILMLSMLNSEGNGHTVNIIGYQEKDDGNTVDFQLYDCNYLWNMHDGREVRNVLEVKKKTCEEGFTDSFTYYYKPYSDCKYEYNSEYSVTGMKVFLVNDTDYNFFH